jgi:hypothetical protein
MAFGAQTDSIQIRINGYSGNVVVCTAILLVPEKVLSEAGYIRALTAGPTTQSKHEFHTMAQTALMPFEDGELPPLVVNGTIEVTGADGKVGFDRGLLIARLPAGNIVLFIKTDQSAHELLKAAYRFCTRWIRLDL